MIVLSDPLIALGDLFDNQKIVRGGMDHKSRILFVLRYYRHKPHSVIDLYLSTTHILHKLSTALDLEASVLGLEFTSN